jgi:hypothetical protein
MTPDVATLPVGSGPSIAVRLFAALIATIALILLMELPWLDPTSGRGRYFGTAFMITWCAGLLVWSLGLVRQNRSQFGLTTVIVATTLIAVFLGALRTLPVYIPVLLTFGACSLLMLRDGIRTPPFQSPFRSRLGRLLLTFAGALGSAHLIRLVSHALWHVSNAR